MFELADPIPILAVPVNLPFYIEDDESDLSSSSSDFAFDDCPVCDTIVPYNPENPANTGAVKCLDCGEYMHADCEADLWLSEDRSTDTYCFECVLSGSPPDVRACEFHECLYLEEIGCVECNKQE